MENSEKDTLPNLQTVLDAINGLRQEMNEQIAGLRREVNEQITGLRREVNEQIIGLRQEMNEQIAGLRQEMNERFGNVDLRLTNVEQRLAVVETDVREIKQMQFVFENEFDRLKALAHKSLELSHENRADVRIMRKEIEAWSEDVRNLTKQIA